MVSLSLSFLGPFSATLSDEPLPGFRTLKVQALLIYLATGHKTAHRRESLMNLLWPGLPEPSARINLRQIIFHLRRMIPVVQTAEGDGQVDFLVADNLTIQINPAYPCQTDVNIFNELLEKVHAHDHLDLLTCPECQKRLQEAITLYRGDFLADFYLDDSNEFEEWAAVHREALRRRALDALETLASVYIRKKDYRLARTYAEHQLQIDDLRESAYRQLMEALALSGQREEALTQYEICRRRLAEELSMAPTSRITAIYEMIRAGELSLELPPLTGVRGYELKEELGSGAFGTVHRAIQPAIGREVAIKVIRPEYANDAEFIRHFEAEAQIVACLEHPYIVPLYDYWREPDGAYLVMRLFRRGSLQTALQEGPWETVRAVKMIEQVAAALSAIHSQGIIHRDLKPANILLDESGNAYLSDFGISFAPGREVHRKVSSSPTDYISPEQLLDDPLTLQADLYSLGMVLYETLTGEKPYSGLSRAGLIRKHLEESLPPVSAKRPDLPPQVDAIVWRATAKRSADRYPDALSLVTDLRQAFASKSNASEQAVVTMHISPVEIVGANPYKGLRPFRETDAADFFGRQVLVDQLVARLGKNRFLAVVGPSGSGKSSVVAAGVIPALRAGAVPGSEKWFITMMVPGTHPFDKLEAALLPVAVNPPPSLVEPMIKDEYGLLRTIRRILPGEAGSQLLLIIDQFEELYTLVTDERQRVLFINSLVAAVNEPSSPMRLVITLRADFYNYPLEHLPLGELLQQHTEVVLPMSPDELEQAVRSPAKRSKVTLEPGLMAIIATEVRDQPGALPLLQYALTELFEARSNHMMTKSAYQVLGGIVGALGRRAEALYTSLDEAGQTAARQLFQRLVTLGEQSGDGALSPDTRRRVLSTELEALIPAHSSLASHAEVNMDETALRSGVRNVLDAFGRHRLLTFDRDPLTRGATVEVAHEALLREWLRLRGWLEESHDDIHLQRRLAEAAAEWLKSGREQGYLLGGSRLEQFAAWAAMTSLALTPDERSYLDASLAERQRQRSEEEVRQERELETARKLAETQQARAEEQTQSAGRLRRRAAYLAVALVIVAILAGLALSFGRSANTSANLAATRQAEAQNSAAQAMINANLAGTRQVEAITSANLAATRQAEAEAESMLRTTAEAVALQEREVAETNFIRSDSLRLALEAEKILGSSNGNVETAALLSIQSLQRMYTPLADASLAQSMAHSYALRMFRGHDAWINSVAFSADGRTILTGSFDKTAKIWETDTGAEIRTFSGHTDFVTSAIFSPDGQYVLTGSFDRTAKLWDADSGTEIRTFSGHTGEVWEVAFSPDGQYVLTASSDGTAKLWLVATGLEVRTFQSEDLPVIYSVAFSPDGRQVVAGGDGITQVFQWDVTSGEQVGTINSVGATIFAVAYSSDGKYILGGCWDHFVYLWDAATGVDVRTFKGHTGPVSNTVVFSPDGRFVLASGDDGTARMWEADTGNEVRIFSGHTQFIIDTANLSAAGMSLVGSLGGSKNYVQSAAFSPDGKTVLTGGADGIARLWDADPDHEAYTFRHADVIVDVAYSPDGQYVATAGQDNTAKLWDAATGKMIQVFTGHSDRIFGIAFSPNTKYLLTGSLDKTAKLWEISTGQEVRTFSGHTSYVVGVAYSPDGKYVLTAGFEGVAKLWNAATGTEVRTFAPESSIPIRSVAFSPDGSTILTGSNVGDVLLWDINTGKQLRSFIGHEVGVTSVAFSPDGTFALTGSWDSTARLWDIATGAEIRTFSGHTNLVNRAVFSPDGQYVLTGSADMTAKLWLTSTGEELRTYSGHTNQVISVAFSPDGRYVLTGSFDGTARLFDIDYHDSIRTACSHLLRDLTDVERTQYEITSQTPTCP